MNRQNHFVDPQEYIDYYLNQSGYGLPVYSGTRIQRGYGLGGFFASLFRSALPLIKRGAKVVGRELLRTGVGVARDALKGENVKDSAKRRFTETGKDLAARAVTHAESQLGSGVVGGGVCKRKTRSNISFISHRTSKRPHLSQKKLRKPDIFGT